MTFEKYEEIRIRLNQRWLNEKSKWSCAVAEYADEVFESIIDEDEIILGIETTADLEKALLNGATNWKNYSWGGCSLVYNYDIAQRCCTPSKFKKTNGGNNRPNKNEEWLDVQARALYQAWLLIKEEFTR